MKDSLLAKLVLAIITFLAIVVGMIGIIRFVAGGGEDSWICTGGEWVKHGQPVHPSPTTGCGD